MNVFNIVRDEILEDIFDNTASCIINEQWDIADPDNKAIEDSDESCKLGNEISQRITPLIRKEWDEMLIKHQIEYTTVANFKKMFDISEELSLDKIYNLYLKFDDKIAVMSDDASSIYNYSPAGEDGMDNYPVFLLNKETVAKISVGFNKLKEQGVSSDRHSPWHERITISDTIEAAGDYKFEDTEPKIKYEDVSSLRKIVISKIKESIVEDDEYYFHSTSKEEKVSKFLQENNIYLIDDEGDFPTSVEEWESKHEYINTYCFFKNLHLFDLERTRTYYNIKKDTVERPSCGWLCLRYKENFLMVPKDLVLAWAKE
jgi:hypothetical protein